MASYLGNQALVTGPFYCSSCGAGLSGLSGKVGEFAGKVKPGEDCPNCRDNPDKELRYDNVQAPPAPEN